MKKTGSRALPGASVKAWYVRAWLAGMVLLGALDTAAAEPKRVMVLHSFGRDFKPWSDYARAIRTELERQSPWPLDITDHSLVTARSSDEDPDAAFVEYLRALFAKRPLDLIVSIGAPAAAFVQRHRSRFFANTPMVFTAVDERRIRFTALSENDAVVAVRINYFAAFENILRVLPETKHVMVVVGTSPIEKFWMEEIGKEVKPLTNRISVTWTNGFSFEDLLKHAATLPRHTVIFWELMIVDAAGVVHEGNTALARLHAVANAPIFSYDDAFFGHGIVGGPLLAVLDSSRQTAAAAIRILGGEKAGNIKTPIVQFATPRFDWREIQRWDISDSRLPPGSEIHFREPTAWERYRWQLTAIFAGLLLQAAMIMALLVERHRRQKAELDARARMLEVMHLSRSAEVGAMSASFAHELSQPLSTVAINAETALQLSEKGPQEGSRLKEKLSDIQQANQHAIDIMRHMRRLLKRRTEVPLQEFDVNEVIADALRILSPEAHKRNVSLSTRGPQHRLPVRADPIHLQQVILNLAINGMDAMAHTDVGARMMTIETALDGDWVGVSVSDSGTGIPEGQLSKVFETFYTTKPDGTGLGLSIARDIIERYGGKIWAEHRPGGGTIFVLNLPLARPA